MYTLHDGKKEILLWCYSAQESSKRPHPPDEADESSSSQKRSRYNKQIDKNREVEEIEDDLRSNMKANILRNRSGCGHILFR